MQGIRQVNTGSNVHAVPLLPAVQPALRPELRFVIECVRRSCGATAGLLPSSVDWSAVLGYATAQGVLTSVDAVLQSSEIDAPADIRGLIGTGAAMTSMHRQHRQEPGIQLSLKTLLEIGCSPVVLKGVALAYSRYTRPALRSFADIDLLLPESQLERANRGLLAAGFTLDTSFTMGSDHQHLPPLIAPRQAIPVELHDTLFEKRGPFSLATSELLARARPITILGLPVRELAPTDALIHICAHLSHGHRYERYPLRSLADVLVLARSGEVDWIDLVVRVRRARMDGAIVWPLVLARAWFGAPIPTGVIQMLARPHPLRRMINSVMHSGYILDRSTVPDDGSRVLFDLVLDLSIHSGCSPIKQGEVLLNGLFPPTHGVTHLPPDVLASSALYVRELTRLRRLRRGFSAIRRLMTRGYGVVGFNRGQTTDESSGLASVPPPGAPPRAKYVITRNRVESVESETNRTDSEGTSAQRVITGR